MMTKIMGIKILALLMITALIVLIITGCSGYKKGIKEPRLLSAEEKSELITIALNTDEVKSVIEQKEFIQVKIGWSMIMWRDDGSLFEININTRYDYKQYQDQFEKGLAEGKEIFSAIVIEMGEPIDYGVTVSINPDTMKIADVRAHPITPGTPER